MLSTTEVHMLCWLGSYAPTMLLFTEIKLGWQTHSKLVSV